MSRPRIDPERYQRPECHYCFAQGAAAGLMLIDADSPVGRRAPYAVGKLLCNDCRHNILTGRT